MNDESINRLAAEARELFEAQYLCEVGPTMPLELAGKWDAFRNGYAARDAEVCVWEPTKAYMSDDTIAYWSTGCTALLQDGLSGYCCACGRRVKTEER